MFVSRRSEVEKKVSHPALVFCFVQIVCHVFFVAYIAHPLHWAGHASMTIDVLVSARFTAEMEFWPVTILRSFSTENIWHEITLLEVSFPMAASKCGG